MHGEATMHTRNAAFNATRQLGSTGVAKNAGGAGLRVARPASGLDEHVPHAPFPIS